MTQLQRDSDNEYFKNSRIMLGLAELGQAHLFPGIFFRARPIQFKRLEDSWGSERFGAELERVLRAAFADANLSTEAKSAVIKLASRQAPALAESYLEAPPDLGFDLTLPDDAFEPIPGNDKSDDLPPPLPFPWELTGADMIEYQSKIAHHEMLSSNQPQAIPQVQVEITTIPTPRHVKEVSFDPHPSWIPSLANPAPSWIDHSHVKSAPPQDKSSPINFSPHPSWQPKLSQPAPEWTITKNIASVESGTNLASLPDLLDIDLAAETQSTFLTPTPVSEPDSEQPQDHPPRSFPLIDSCPPNTFSPPSGFIQKPNEARTTADETVPFAKQPTPGTTEPHPSITITTKSGHSGQIPHEHLPFAYKSAQHLSSKNVDAPALKSQNPSGLSPIKVDYDKAIESIIARDAKTLDALAPHGSIWPINSRWTIASLCANLDWSEGLNIAKANGFSLDEPDGENITPLDRSIVKKAWRATSTLLALGAKPTLSRSRNLVCALVNANATLNAILAALLRGADPNAPDAQGKYPIHHAAATGSKAFCEILIKHKARLDMPDAEGQLPRAIAKLHKHYDLSHYLQSEAIRHKNK